MERIVIPGEKLGVIEQYLPGEGTYLNSSGVVVSNFLGEAISQNRKIAVKPVREVRYPLSVGDIVIAIIWSSERSQFLAKILALFKPKELLLKSPMSAIILKKTPENRAALPGDFVLAKVESCMGGDIYLTRSGSTELGVISAMCRKCNVKLNRVGYTLVCNKCQQVYLDRKISDHYGLNPFERR
jgi:exosome complex component CSL4